VQRRVRHARPRPSAARAWAPVRAAWPTRRGSAL
jgi:hypothetical protein